VTHNAQSFWKAFSPPNAASSVSPEGLYIRRFHWVRYFGAAMLRANLSDEIPRKNGIARP